MAIHVLLTGATGFLGKVVLAQLLRQRGALAVDRVTLVVRPKRGVAPDERLRREVLASPCFADCPEGWQDQVDAVAGNLSEPNAGLTEEDAAWLRPRITHVIHCAASVDFDRPIAEAAAANITSSLNVLALAKRMPKLQRFVTTSTAYVTPWREGPIPEALAPLPRPAAALWADVQAGVDEAKLMAETGHANTYTYTKCLAEHLLVAERGDVPLSIVRPSIISASWRAPQPGWIDSKAAFAGFVFTIGAGLLRVIDANPDTRLDIVPVDVVADRLLAAAFNPPANDVIDIVHAAVGLRHAAHIGQTSAAIVAFFRRHRVARRPVLKYLGGRNARFLWRNLLHHDVPHSLHAVRARLLRDAKGRKQAARVRKTLHTINQVFPYFTHNTFDFVCRTPMADDFAPARYVEAVCRGVATNLMRRDAARVVVAGRQARGGAASVRWALRREGPVATRLAFAALRLGLGRTFDEVSFDENAFAAAHAAVAEGMDVVWVPSDGSVISSLLLRYLTFARPDLGFAVPSLAAGAAAVAAGSLPWHHAAAARRRAAALRGGQRAGIVAPRGQGAALGAPLDAAVLQDWHTGARPVALVPVTFNYSADLTQLLAQLPPHWTRLAAGADVKVAVRWLAQLARNAVQLGSVHVVAGAPLPLVPQASAPRAPSAEQASLASAQALRQALQAGRVACDGHLRAFLALQPQLGLDLGQLRRAITARGGRVLGPRLTRLTAGLPDHASERRLRRSWQHVFAGEMVQRWPQATALADFFEVAAAPAPRQAPAAAPASPALLQALAGPIVVDFAAVGEAVDRLLPAGASLGLHELLEAASCRDREVGEVAVRTLVRQGVLRLVGSAAAPALERQHHSDATLARYRAGCSLHGAADKAGPSLQLRVAQAGEVHVEA